MLKREKPQQIKGVDEGGGEGGVEGKGMRERFLNPELLARRLLSSFWIPWVLLGLFAVLAAAAAAVVVWGHYCQAVPSAASEALADVVFAALEEAEGDREEGGAQQEQQQEQEE